MKLSKRFVMLTFLIVALAGGTRWALSQGEGTILACAAKNGHLRIIADPAECKDNETVLEWNIVGPPGPKGDKGDPGPPGPPGTTDWNGLTNIPHDIADGDDDALGRLNCTTDQVAKFDGTSWVCANDLAELQGQIDNLKAELDSLRTRLGNEAIARANADDALQEDIDVLEDLLVHFSRDGDDVYVTGANLHVVNGGGYTTSANGVGNVIIGYNELRGDGTDNRTGSHMLVVGAQLNYSRFGGIVAGRNNTASGDFSSVSGGYGNTASGAYASVLGGNVNIASGLGSTVSGGDSGFAGGAKASISGGVNNFAMGTFSSVSGGYGNTASGFTSASVSGGYGNTASGAYASVSGGRQNTASGRHSSVSGGLNNTASGPPNEDSYSSVCGGQWNTASGVYSSVCGGYGNTASGTDSSVSGGKNRSATGNYDWRAGTYFSDE